MRPRIAAAAAVLVAWGALTAWPAKKAKPDPRAQAVAALVEKVMGKGEGAVIGAPLAGYLNVDDPTTCRVLHFLEGPDGLSHSIFVALNPGTRPDQRWPQFLFFVTKQSMPSREEKRYLRVSLNGRLEQVTVVADKLDERGLPVLDARAISNVSVGKKEARDWFEHELEYYSGSQIPGRAQQP